MDGDNVDAPELVPTRINQRWELLLPPHRAERAEWWDGWEKERISAMYEAISPGHVVYDIGSEEGDLPALWADWTSMYVCQECGYKRWHQTWREDSDIATCCTVSCDGVTKKVGGVVLFEPNPKVFSNIRAVFEGNGLKPLDMYAGFAGEHTTAEFDNQPRTIDPEQFWPDAAYDPVIRDHGFANLCERPDIPAITIDDHSASRGLVPDVITIDTEGSELRVLRGATAVLTEHRPKVFVSVHPEFMRQMYGDEPEDLRSFMARLGYEAIHIATDHEEHWQFLPE